MTERTRRLLIGTAIVVVVLFVGRWSSEFLAERWWAATISPAAVKAVTRWWILGLGLDALAISFASLWFVLQALAIGRTVKAVHITRHIGNLELREAIPTRVLLSGAAGLGILLGWLSGAGAHAWRAPVALAWQGVVWPVEVPVIKTQLGTFITKLPLWQLTLDFLYTLIILAMALSVTLYFVIGAIKRHNRNFEINPIARSHLGVLFAMFAMVIGIEFLIGPWETMASAELGASMQGVLSHRFLSIFLFGGAFFAAVASLRWGAKGQGGFLIAGWGVLVLAMVGNLLASPTSPVTDSDRAQLRTFTDLAWGIVRSDEPPSNELTPPAPAIWDERFLRFAEYSAGRQFLAATPGGTGGLATPDTRYWLIAATDSSREIVQVHAVAEGRLNSDGGPESISALSQNIPHARVRPEAPLWERVSGGVTAGNLLTKLILAWGKQFGGVASTTGALNIDWHLDPTERARALLPMAVWLQPDIVMVNGELTWLVQGLIPLTAFPLGTSQILYGQDISALEPAFVALIDVASGSIKFYLDAGSSPPAEAWRQVVPGLIQPADSLPASLQRDMPYNGGWLTLQLAALTAAGFDHNSGATAAAVATPVVWQGGVSGRQYLDADGRLAFAIRENGAPRWRTLPVGLAVESRRDALQQEFHQQITLSHLRDSIQAAGDTAIAGALRWWVSGDQIVAWRPLIASNRERGPKVVGIATAQNGSTWMVRRPEDAWVGHDSAADDLAALQRGESVQLREARLWLARADSALRRGDLTAFGRYFESLQRVLGKGP